MVKVLAYEDFQTVPVVDMEEMSPYMKLAETNGQSFPLPGEAYNFIRLDLSLALIRNPAHTFFLRINQETLGSEGYCRGHIAVVDRHAQPRHRQVIAAYYEGSFIICRLMMQEGALQIQTDEETTDLEPDMDFSIWGVVRDVLPIR